MYTTFSLSIHSWEYYVKWNTQIKTNVIKCGLLKKQKTELIETENRLVVVARGQGRNESGQKVNFQL